MKLLQKLTSELHLPRNPMKKTTTTIPSLRFGNLVFTIVFHQHEF